MVNVYNNVQITSYQLMVYAQTIIFVQFMYLIKMYLFKDFHNIKFV